MNVLDIARRFLLYCQEDDYISKISDELQRNNVSSILVRDELGKTVGIITVGDILRRVAGGDNVFVLKAKHIMSFPVITARNDDSVDELLKKFADYKVTRLVLLDENEKPVGVIRDSTLRRFIQYESARKLAEREVATRF